MSHNLGSFEVFPARCMSPAAVPNTLDCQFQLANKCWWYRQAHCCRFWSCIIPDWKDSLDCQGQCAWFDTWTQSPCCITLTTTESKRSLWGVCNCTKATAETCNIVSTWGVKAICTRTTSSTIVCIIVWVAVSRHTLAIALLGITLCWIFVRRTFLTYWALWTWTVGGWFLSTNSKSSIATNRTDRSIQGTKPWFAVTGKGRPRSRRWTLIWTTCGT